jgi:opacity protein-like surface antigen
MKTFLAIAALAACQLAAAQKTQEFKELKKITIGSDIQLDLVKGSENKLVVDNEDAFEVRYDAGSLVLNGDGHATLYYKAELESLTVGSDTKVKGTDELKGKTLQITAGTDSNITLDLNVQDLQITVGSDAQVSLTGKAGKMTATIGSDGKFNAEGLDTGDASVNLGSDAEGNINAKGTVNATVASDANLTIHGNPEKVNEVKGSDAEINIVR